MPSNINPFNIDGSFPIAGQDNNSQGFRDNFTNIRNNLGFAKAELEDLQAKAVLKAPLTGSSLENDMEGTTMSRVNLKAYTETVHTITKSPFTNVITVDYNNGNVQFYDIVDNSIVVEFTGWPISNNGSLVLWVYVTNYVAYNLTIPVFANDYTPAENGYTSLAGVTIDGNDAIIKFDAPGNYFFEFTSRNAGRDIMVRRLETPSAVFRDHDFYHNPAQYPGTDGFFVNYKTLDALNTARQTIEAVDPHSLSVRGGVNSVVAGDLSTVSINDFTVGTDQGTLSGYSVSSARGNLTVGALETVESNDYLGYVNSFGYMEYENTGNLEYQQSGSMSFYATGPRNLANGENTITSNVEYGLGGNIAFYTKPFGDQSIAQAMGIEENLSVKFFGNIITSPIGTPELVQGTPGETGQIVVAGDYLYVCTSGSDVSATWKRVALSAFA